jgi:hypothetical protein
VEQHEGPVQLQGSVDLKVGTPEKVLKMLMKFTAKT